MEMVGESPAYGPLEIQILNRIKEEKGGKCTQLRSQDAYDIKVQDLECIDIFLRSTESTVPTKAKASAQAASGSLTKSVVIFGDKCLMIIRELKSRVNNS
jgi:hypothetical protein